jgi:hypothetical protein
MIPRKAAALFGDSLDLPEVAKRAHRTQCGPMLVPKRSRAHAERNGLAVRESDDELAVAHHAAGVERFVEKRAGVADLGRETVGRPPAQDLLRRTAQDLLRRPVDAGDHAFAIDGEDTLGDGVANGRGPVSLHEVNPVRSAARPCGAPLQRVGTHQNGYPADRSSSAAC